MRDNISFGREVVKLPVAGLQAGLKASHYILDFDVLESVLGHEYLKPTAQGGYLTTSQSSLWADSQASQPKRSQVDCIFIDNISLEVVKLSCWPPGVMLA